MIIGIIAARPGSIRIRVSRAMSFGPNTNPASRVLGSREAAAKLVGIQHRARGLDHCPNLDRCGRAPIAASRSPIALRSSTRGNLGHQDAVRPRCAGHRDVVGPPWRYPGCWCGSRFRACQTPWPQWPARSGRAPAPWRPAPRNPRDRGSCTSAGRLRAFSSARAFDPGMNNRLRRGRIMGGVPLEFAEPDAISFQRPGPKVLFPSPAYG